MLGCESPGFLRGGRRGGGGEAGEPLRRQPLRGGGA